MDAFAYVWQGEHVDQAWTTADSDATNSPITWTFAAIGGDVTTSVLRSMGKLVYRPEFTIPVDELTLLWRGSGWRGCRAWPVAASGRRGVQG
jgi:hypothetical protein